MFNNWLNKLCALAVLALVLVGIGPPPAYAAGTTLVPVNDKLGFLGSYPVGTIPNDGGLCPPEVQQVFGFYTGFQNTSSFTLTNLTAQVTTLTGGNPVAGLIDFSSEGGLVPIGPVPVGGMLPLVLGLPGGPPDYADGFLSPGEQTIQLFYVCLKSPPRPFRLFVDILGQVVP